MLDGINIKDVSTTAKAEVVTRMKEKLCDILDSGIYPSIFIVVLELPVGTKEIIQNTDQICTKVKYYTDTYALNGQHNKVDGLKILDFLML